jgi:hypothetical protein
MINNFIVKAFPERNLLKICMDGYFLRSELELALHLTKSESRKLKNGFKVIIDIRNMKTPINVLGINFSKLKRMLTILGAENLHFVGVDYASSKSVSEYVGFYPN